MQPNSINIPILQIKAVDLQELCFLQSLKNIMAILYQKRYFPLWVIISWLKYRPNSAQIDCDKRDRWADKNLRLSIWGDGGIGLIRRIWRVKKLPTMGAGVRETGLILPTERQGKLEGDQLIEREIEGLGGVKGHKRTENGERKGSRGHYWTCGPAQ